MALGINEATINILSQFQLQQMNQFSITFYPANSGISNISAGDVGSVLFDNAISKFHIQEINVPFASVVSERNGDDYYITGIDNPGEVSIKFIENELAPVRNWVVLLQNEVYGRDDKFGLYLKENQLGAEKHAIISTLDGNGIATPAFMKIENMKYKQLGELGFTQNNPEPMYLDVMFNCKTVILDAPISLSL